VTVKRTFNYEFTDTSPRTMRFDYAGSQGEVLKAEASTDHGLTVFVNRGAALVLARVFAQLAVSDYHNGFHVHLREDLDADKPEQLTIVFQE
jgi:hypothetical protein